MDVGNAWCCVSEISIGDTTLSADPGLPLNVGVVEATEVLIAISSTSSADESGMILRLFSLRVFVNNFAGTGGAVERVEAVDIECRGSAREVSTLFHSCFNLCPTFSAGSYFQISYHSF